MDVVELTDDNFHQEIFKSRIPYLVDFWAVWCGPCRMMAPVVEEIALQYDGKLKVGKLNVDNEIKTANEFNINSIPTLIIFANGRETDRIIGAVPKDYLIERIKGCLLHAKTEIKTKKAIGKEEK